MHYRKSITAMLCLVGILIIAPTVGGTVSAQDLLDPADLLSQYLPEGSSFLTASKSDMAEAVEKAVSEHPGRAAAIVRAAVAARPDAVTEIVTAAVGVSPDNLNDICLAAMDAASERALDIHICQEVFDAAVRLESMPVTTPVREEPSPIRPR
jgi:DNA-binding transcriptional regulator YdaS (Cro superfamily)